MSINTEASSTWPPAHLVLLFEAVAFGRLHLVDVLQEVGHSDGRVELPGVVGGALPATVAVRGTSQQAAGLVDGAALLVCSTENTHSYYEWEKISRYVNILATERLKGSNPSLSTGLKCLWPRRSAF